MKKDLSIALVLLVLLSACSVKTSSSSDDPQAGEAQPQVSQSYYYDFDDIMVPEEMDLDIDESFVIETPDQKSGVMVFDGNVEIRSLTDYFINNMPRDNWQMLSAFRSARTILVFKKDNRSCVVNITDSNFTTLLEIWVSPLEQ